MLPKTCLILRSALKARLEGRTSVIQLFVSILHTLEDRDPGTGLRRCGGMAGWRGDAPSAGAARRRFPSSSSRYTRGDSGL